MKLQPLMCANEPGSCFNSDATMSMQGNDLLSERFDRGFQCFAQQQARYVLGEGWRRRSCVAGVDAPGYSRHMHHGAACPTWPAACPPDAAISDREDANAIVGGLLWLPEVRCNST
jgi:hypothetical protein